MVLLSTPRGVVTEAAICDNVHCEDGVYPSHNRVPLADLAAVLLSYPPPTVAVFGARRRQVYFPKKVSAAAARHTVSGKKVFFLRRAARACLATVSLGAAAL